MIEVFDVMAISGSGNARAMAAGVSQATVSTMAGMVSALLGTPTFPRLQRRAEKESENSTMDSSNRFLDFEVRNATEV